jgi:hypothetical protein
VDKYRVMPGSGEWVSEEDMISKVARWAVNAPEHGAPSITISKLVQFDTDANGDVPDGRGPRCGDTTIVVTGEGDHLYTCDRDPGHTAPHRDVQQKGTETVSWSRTRPTR